MVVARGVGLCQPEEYFVVTTHRSVKISQARCPHAKTAHHILSPDSLNPHKLHGKQDLRSSRGIYECDNVLADNLMCHSLAEYPYRAQGPRKANAKHH